MPATADPGAECSCGHAAPDPQAALPHRQRPQRLTSGAEVQLRIRHHVVKARTDQSKRNGPGHDRVHLLRSATRRSKATPGDGHRDHHARQDRQGVRPNRQRPYMPDSLRWAGQEGMHHLTRLPRAQPAGSARQCVTDAAAASSKAGRRPGSRITSCGGGRTASCSKACARRPTLSSSCLQPAAHYAGRSVGQQSPRRPRPWRSEARPTPRRGTVGPAAR